MRIELRTPLVRKPMPANIAKKREMTGEELCKAMAERAEKILKGEPVEPVGWNLEVY
ncbi:hypothetical protein [Pseudomonas maumuensis]|uniref:Uncharacterized protein n=1 Tax=Pseudomonas maumuensis TaxID=2842354 RepID=A0ABX8NNY3_9PSED|nr:hypothetical protein [Pseudomonas maumuensis]QXH57698.1 hypothetical protein KSS90_05715 [Pseudomonas maumuensis]